MKISSSLLSSIIFAGSIATVQVRAQHHHHHHNHRYTQNNNLRTIDATDGESETTGRNLNEVLSYSYEEVEFDIGKQDEISSPTRDEDIVSAAYTENKETVDHIFSSIYNWLHLVLKELGHFDIPSDETSAKSGKSKSSKTGSEKSKSSKTAGPSPSPMDEVSFEGALQLRLGDGESRRVLRELQGGLGGLTPEAVTALETSIEETLETPVPPATTGLDVVRIEITGITDTNGVLDVTFIATLNSANGTSEAAAQQAQQLAEAQLAAATTDGSFSNTLSNNLATVTDCGTGITCTELETATPSFECDSPPTCDLEQVGKDGTSNFPFSETFIQGGVASMQDCVDLVKATYGLEANGATWGNNVDVNSTSFGDCYAEFNQEGTDNSTNFNNVLFCCFPVGFEFVQECDVTAFGRDGNGEDEKFLRNATTNVPLVVNSTEECVALVKEMEPTANGATWGRTVNSTFGDCFAEFNQTTAIPCWKTPRWILQSSTAP